MNGAALALALGLWTCVFIRGQQISAARLLTSAPVDQSIEEPPAPSRSTEPSAPVPEEVIRLRAEAAQLIQKLKALQGTNNPSATAKRKVTVQDLPPGYHLATFAEYRGQGSPEAALESMVWALRSSEDENQVFNLITGQKAAKFRAEFDQHGWTVVRQMKPAGYRVIAQDTQPNGAIRLSVEIIPNRPPEVFDAVRGEDGQWRINLDAGDAY